MQHSITSKAAILALSLTTLSLSASAQQYKELLQPFIDAGGVPGVVTVVANAEKVLDLTCVGWADVEKKQPMTPDTLFWIASQSKPITATAAMILRDEGKLDLDRPAADYLPELKNLRVLSNSGGPWRIADSAPAPTVRQLLSHTSGLEFSNLAQQRAGNKFDVVSLQDSVPIAGAMLAKFQPGAEYLYSNLAFDLVAAIIEKQSGLAYEDFLQQRLFGPLGMTRTTFWPAGAQLEQLAADYRLAKDGVTPEAFENSGFQYPLDDRAKRFPSAAGGLFSTPSDLVKFYQMIGGKGVYNGVRIVSEAAVAEMGQKQTGEHLQKNSYGLGWFVSPQSMWHGGAHGTDTTVYKKTGLVVMWFTQHVGLPKVNDAVIAFRREIDQTYVNK